MKTFRQMIDEVLRYVQDAGPGSEEIVRAALNRNYLRIAAKRLWPELIVHTEATVSYVANSVYFALPPDADIPLFVADSTQKWKLQQKSPGHLVDDALGFNTKSTLFYTPLGLSPIMRPMSTADTLTLVAESNSDSVTVRVRGRRSSPDIIDYEDVVLSGTTSVAGSMTWNSEWSILSISTNEPRNGYVKVSETTSGDVLAYIERDNARSQYSIIMVDQAPSSASNVILTYKRKVPKLVSDEDVPIIDATDAILEATVAEFRRYEREYSQAAFHDRLAERDIDDRFAKREQSAGARYARPNPTFYVRPRGY